MMHVSVLQYDVAVICYERDTMVRPQHRHKSLICFATNAPTGTLMYAKEMQKLHDLIGSLYIAIKRCDLLRYARCEVTLGGLIHLPLILTISQMRANAGV